MNERQVQKVEQAIRMLSGKCPHNRPDSETPRTKGNCITCIAEASIQAIEKELG